MNLGCRRNSRPYVDAGVQKLGAEENGGGYNFIIRNFIIFSIILFSDVRQPYIKGTYNTAFRDRVGPRPRVKRWHYLFSAFWPDTDSTHTHI